MVSLLSMVSCTKMVTFIVLQLSKPNANNWFSTFSTHNCMGSTVGEMHVQQCHHHGKTGIGGKAVFTACLRTGGKESAKIEMLNILSLLDFSAPLYSRLRAVDYITTTL